MIVSVFIGGVANNLAFLSLTEVFNPISGKIGETYVIYTISEKTSVPMAKEYLILLYILFSLAYGILFIQVISGIRSQKEFECRQEDFFWKNIYLPYAPWLSPAWVAARLITRGRSGFLGAGSNLARTYIVDFRKALKLHYFNRSAEYYVLELASIFVVFYAPLWDGIIAGRIFGLYLGFHLTYLILISLQYNFVLEMGLLVTLMFLKGEEQ